MADRHWLGVLLGCALGALPVAARAEPADGSDWRDALQAAPSRLYDLLSTAFRPTRRKRPEWLVEQSHDEFEPGSQSGVDAAHLVLQQDRRDGADLLTLRYPIAESGSLRSYVGAGLHEAVYFSEAGTDPALNNRRNRHRSLGPAAEVGAELRLSETINLTGDVRWIEIAGDAGVMKSKNGLVGADAVSVGVSIGWRFR